MHKQSEIIYKQYLLPAFVEGEERWTVLLMFMTMAMNTSCSGQAHSGKLVSWLD
jgi:hypothetical protein